MIQDFTYHSHTNFDGIFDGHNTALEMIQKAEELDFKEIGISNHLCCHPNIKPDHPMFFNDFSMAREVYQQLIADIRNASRQSKIKVYVGFEVDFFISSTWRKTFEKLLSELNVDYLIGSVHNIVSDDESTILNLYLNRTSRDNPNIIKYFPNYWKIITEGVKSGYFDFMGHIDLFKIFNIGTEPVWDSEKRKLVDVISKYHQPVELNTSGWNKCGEQHPHTWMLESLARNDVPLVISDDAHSVSMIGQHFERAETLLSQMGAKNRWKMTPK